MSALPATPSAHSLADVMPSVAAALGVGDRNPLGLGATRDAVLVLVDGMGAELLRRHAGHAPTLAALAGRMITAGFPATTATSLTSLAVGAPCSEHGIVGYSFRIEDAGGAGALLNPLRWTLDSAGGPSAVDRFPPREVQRMPSIPAVLAAEGVDVTYVMPGEFRDSGLTRAAFRQVGDLRPATSLGEVRRGVLDAVRPPSGAARFVYAYHGYLDLVGHLHGPGSPEWLTALSEVDEFVAELAADLPRDCTLLVTADHGMVAAEIVVDIDSDPALLADVAMIAGEPRVRHVHARPGAEQAVLDAWRDRTAGRARVISREQALDERLFGPGRDHADRLGHVIAIADGGVVLVRTRHEALESSLLGHHGANTPAEQHIPLIVRA